MNKPTLNTKKNKIEMVLNGEVCEVPPIWMMRQAGRYLPEYRALRKKAGSFLDLCYNPEFAAEVTLQPIRRFDFDAAILFSDILVIPDAMGREVNFVEGEGPRLDPITKEEINRLDDQGALEHLKPVLDAVTILRSELSNEKALLGFCGAPWTVATYMIAGRGTPDQAPARLFAYSHKNEFQILIDKLCNLSAEYLIAQLHSGVDAVQIFDSWSGVLSKAEFEQWCVAPVRKIVELVRKEIPDAKIIGFPKGAGFFIKDYRENTEVDCLGLDWTVPFDVAKDLQHAGAIQGNLDPLTLIAGGDALDHNIDAIMENLSNGPLIFNLGHGITPQTPISNVERMIKRVRTGKS